MTARLVVAAALAALPGLVSAQTVEEVLRNDGWQGAAAMSDDSIGFFGGLMNRADWNNPAPECVTVKDFTERMFSEVAWYIGKHTGHWGEYYPEVTLSNGDTIQVVAFNRDLWPLPSLALESLLHEGAHHAGFTHAGSFDAYDAESCAVLKPLQPPPPNSGTGTTCTDETYTYKEWDWVYTEIEAGSCVGVSPVRWPWEEGGDDEDMHCTPARWGYVLMEVEKTGVRTVCVPTSN